ncbi:hypothetical protein D3652_23075, partial [Escherichia coli]|nr:hypothetical protein [Escherichia coli]
FNDSSGVKIFNHGNNLMLSNNVVTHGDLFHCLNVNGKNMWTTYDITSLIVMDNRNIAYFLY